MTPNTLMSVMKIYSYQRQQKAYVQHRKAHVQQRKAHVRQQKAHVRQQKALVQQGKRSYRTSLPHLCVSFQTKYNLRVHIVYQSLYKLLLIVTAHVSHPLLLFTFTCVIFLQNRFNDRLYTTHLNSRFPSSSSNLLFMLSSASNMKATVVLPAKASAAFFQSTVK